jgi:hypothetical protein
MGRRRCRRRKSHVIKQSRGAVGHNKLSIGVVIADVVSTNEMSVGAQSLISLVSGEKMAKI